MAGGHTWLGRRKIAFVVLHIDVPAESMPSCSPIPNLIFVVSVKRARIKHERLVGVTVSSRILVPEITMNEAGLDRATVRLQGL